MKTPNPDGGGGGEVIAPHYKKECDCIDCKPTESWEKEFDDHFHTFKLSPKNVKAFIHKLHLEAYERGREDERTIKQGYGKSLVSYMDAVEKGRREVLDVAEGLIPKKGQYIDIKVTGGMIGTAPEQYAAAGFAKAVQMLLSKFPKHN